MDPTSNSVLVPAGPALARLHAAIDRGPGQTVVKQLLALPASRYGDLLAGQHRRYPDRPPIRNIPAAEAQLLESLPVHPNNNTRRRTQPTRPTRPPGRPPRRRDPVVTVHRRLWLSGCRCTDCHAIMRWYARAAYARRHGRPAPPRPALAGHHADEVRATIRPVVSTRSA